MAFKLTPDEIEKWKAFAWKYYHTQQKLLQKRQQLQAVQKHTESELKRWALQPESYMGRFLSLQQRMIALSLQQLETFPVESTVYTPAVGVHSAVYEARSQELSLILLQREHLVMGELDKLAADALKLDADAPAHLWEVWEQERQAMRSDAKRAEAWMKYRSEYAQFDTGLAQALQTLAEPPEVTSVAERLERLQAIKIPVLSGQSYRVTSVLKQLPCGEALLDKLREYLNTMPTPKPTVAAGKSKPITNRLKDLFKPPS